MTILVWALSIVTAMVILSATRGIMFPGTKTDQEKEVRAAARSREWRWPSGMHQFAQGKSYMKDVGVLGLAILQRLMKDVHSPYPLTVLAAISHTVSAGLLFVVAEGCWTTQVAFGVFFLYLTCFWPYQIVLLGGFQGLAQMLLLGSVACFQQASSGLPGGAPWYVAGGILMGGMLFASASGRKFLPLAVGAFLFSQRAAIAPLGFTPGGWASLTHGMGPVLVITIGVLALGFVLVVAFKDVLFRRLITAIYLKRAGWLNGCITARTQFPLTHYLAKGSTVLPAVTTLGVRILAVLIVCVVLSRTASFYLTQGLVLLGMGAVVIAFTYPEVVFHLKGYLGYWNINAVFGQFRLYTEHFAKNRIHPLHRAPGLRWLLRFFWHQIPFHCAVYALSLGAIVAASWSSGLPSAWWSALGVVLLSLSPILFGELTRSPHCSRTYFPAFLGLLLGIGYGAFIVERQFAPSARWLWWWLVGGIAVIGAGWNLWVLLRDVWPARMASTWLLDTLRAKGIWAFATYDTPYHNALVDAWPQRVRELFAIRHIQALQDVDEGWIVIPSTSSKSFDMSSEAWSIRHGDFNVDAELTQLLASRAIARYAVAWFKTFGTSRFWGHEHDVISYRDFFLKEVREADRFRGRAWILDAGRLAADRARHEAPHLSIGIRE